MLEHRDVAAYLLSLGVLRAADVVSGDLAVIDASRRNAVFLCTAAGVTHVVKQDARRDGRALAHEAAVLRALAREDARRYVPAVVHHDAETGTLVLRTARGGRDWSAQLPRR